MIRPRLSRLFSLLLFATLFVTATTSVKALPVIGVDSNLTSLFTNTNVRVGSQQVTTFYVYNRGTDTLRLDTTFSRIVGNYPTQYTLLPIPRQLAPGDSALVSVRFAPTVYGTFRDTVRLASNGGIVALPLFGRGIAPQIRVTPSTITFDSTALGVTTCNAILLTNTGTDTLMIRSMTLVNAGPAFQLSPLRGSDTAIAPNGTGVLNLCFTPLSVGTQTATVSIVTNIPSDTNTFTVTASGIGSSIATIGTSTVYLGNTPVGGTICYNDTIRNRGNTPLTILSARVVGADSSNFQLSFDSLPLTIAIGSQSYLRVCATPDTAGAQNANIEVTYIVSGVTRTATIAVIDTGRNVCASTRTTSLFPTIIAVGATDTARVTVTNCGELPSVYNAGLLLDTTNYRIIGPITSRTIQPGDSATFTIVFAPSSADSLRGTLQINGGPGIPTITIPLTGVGGGVRILGTATVVPNTNLGDCKDFTVTVYNRGTVAWTPGTPALTGANVADFHLGTLSSTTIAPGDSAHLTVTFCPTVAAQETATLSFPAGSPSESPAFSLTFSGTGVSVAGVADANAVVLEMQQSYPNPANMSATIGYTLASDAQVSIALMDAKGSLIRTVSAGRLAQGPHSETIDTHDLPSGSYFVVLQTAAGTVTRQIVVMH